MSLSGARLRAIAHAIPGPWRVATIGAAIAAIAFPSHAAGTTGVLILAGLAGIGLAHAWQRRRIEVSARVAGWLALAIVLAVAAYVFAPVFSHSITWVRGDWGPQDAVLRGVVDHLRNFELPHWNHRISTGDAPLDVYPSLTYVLAAAITLVGGFEANLPFVLILLAILAHSLIAISATRLALRFLPAPIAAAIGVALVLDLGSISSGGVVGTIEMGLLHSAVAQVFALSAAVAIVDAVRQPRLSRSIAIWTWTALATAAHPSGLISMLVAAVALVAVALLATDTPPRRAVAAIGHIAIGAGLGAVIWLPLGERIVMYGQHFSDVLIDPAHWLTTLLANPIPVGSFALVVYVGYAGTLGALWSRRAVPVFVATTVVAMLIATSDAVYLAFDLAPSRFTARLGAMRFYGLVRPFVFVAAGSIACLVVAQICDRWRDARGRRFLVGAFVAGIVGLSGLHVGCRGANQLVQDARHTAQRTARDTGPLVSWAREQMRTATPDRWGRALVVESDAYYAHVTSLTGLPAFHFGPIPDVLLRERIEDATPESLRRFNVRWILTDDARPMLLGDPATERELGSFRVREVPTWDGQFARIERGAGRAVITRLDDDVVEVELSETSEPALVALGTGYYPRWRATGPDGKPLQVYAIPATPTGTRHVPAAWIPPGKTRFTPDGPLPSDGDGRGISLVALAGALSIVVIWSRRRLRNRVLRSLARARAIRLPRHAPIAAAVLGSLALLAWGAVATRRAAGALELDADAKVSFKSKEGLWEACSYVRYLAEYHCEDRAIVLDTTEAIVNDGQMMWPFTTPSIGIYPLHGSLIQVRIEASRRLAGRYWAGSRDLPVEIAIAGQSTVTTDAQRTVDLDDREHTVTVTATMTATPLWFTFVREDTLEPERTLPVPPDVAPPR